MLPQIFAALKTPEAKEACTPLEREGKQGPKPAPFIKSLDEGNIGHTPRMQQQHVRHTAAQHMLKRSYTLTSRSWRAPMSSTMMGSSTSTSASRMESMPRRLR